MKRAVLMAAAFALSACAAHPRPQALPRAAAAKPDIVTAADGSRSTTLSVLIYNVAGLPWPQSSGRRAAMRHIGAELAQMRAAGKAPDVVLLQEAFIASAGNIGAKAGYHTILRGPLRSDRAMDFDLPPLVKDFRKDRRIIKGERVGKWTSSGLYILTDYGVDSVAQTPFGRNSCAGFDCLANKGVMLVRLRIPGVPGIVQIFNTHLNARRAARVPLERTHQAYERQMAETSVFLARAYDPSHPFIFGGDFNTRLSDRRYAAKVEVMPGTDVRYHCATGAGACDIKMNWEGDAPWMDTQDIQGFASGSAVSITPVRAEAVFDTPWRNGRTPSDHDGYLVTYRLRWKGTAP